MQKKTIFLGLPRSFDFYKLIIKNLEFHGFEVIDISFHEHNFKIKKITDKLIHAFNKLFFNDFDYKAQLKVENAKVDILNKLNSIKNKADYALIIRSDIYPIDIIKKIKTKTNKLVGYQWDGLHRFPAIYNHIAFYDKFFVFDKKDLNHKKVFLSTNFYFDFEKIENNTINQDFFFVGTYVKNRMQSINLIVDCLEVLRMTYKIVLLTNKPVKEEGYKIQFTNKPIPFNEYLNNLKSSNICLDFLNGIHNGLSFRTFEALCYDKKLITTNKEITNYDFYHPNNIFVLNNNIEDLKEFLQKPFYKIEEEIKLKYGFKNWINNLLLD